MTLRGRFPSGIFLKSLVSGSALALLATSIFIPTVSAFEQSPGLKMFAQPLRGVGPGGIPVATPDPGKAPVTGVTHYTIDITQYQDQLHPALGPTTLRGYKPTSTLGNDNTQRHLGGIIVAQKGVPIQLTFRNRLPLGPHIIPLDNTVMGADGGPERATVHLHGGYVPWISDGGPFTWYSSDPKKAPGPSFIGNQVLNPTAPDNTQGEYYYPNQQSARLVWYHDHTFGTTRLNAYAGVASAYIIRDTYEAGLRALGLPDFVENGGKYEIPIVVQDKIFVDNATIDYFDPLWKQTGAPSTTGSLWYPHVYDYKKWMWLNGPVPPSPTSIIPEMFGDTFLANGTVYPVASIEPRRYRLRILNACQARFLNLQTYVADATPDNITLNLAGNPTNLPGPNFIVIGTEGGFLPTPDNVNMHRPFNPKTLDGSLIASPAERYDVLVDFSGFAGKRIILYTDAPAPFPMGDPMNDMYFGGPGSPTHVGPGYGPNTREIMAFDVAANITGIPDNVSKIVPGLNLKPGNDPFLVAPGSAVKAGVLTLPTTTVFGPVTRIRNLTLNEDFDQFGRLIQMLGTDNALPGALGFGRGYTDNVTEVAKQGDIEIWRIANLTADTHPIHIHLINAQVLAREPFNALTYAGGPAVATGPALGPDALNRGWKETVKMNPGEITTVIMRFTIPQIRTSTGIVVPTPPSPRTGGNEYVWHCHILEHEEHDMMRPLVVY